MDKPPSNRPAKFALNLLNLLKEKQQQHAHACRGREYTGLLLFFEFLESPSEARPERSCQQRLEDRSGFPLISALPSLHRDAMGKVGKGMCQWPNRAPMGRTLFCRRAWERIWLGKGPIALLGGFFWPGNTLTYINPVRRNGGRLIGLCNGIV